MIPLSKLRSLPRHQRLRKCAKIFAEAELRSISDRSGNVVDIEYLASVAGMLAGDEDFPEAVSSAVRGAAMELAVALAERDEGRDPFEFRRPVNSLRHVLNGVVGIQTADWDFIDDHGRVKGTRRTVFPGVAALLEDIRSPFNVGSMFRTAESFGVERMLLSPLCASPEHPRAERTAMGCTALVPWERIDPDTLTGPVFALETGGTPVEEFRFPKRAVMIVGSEELGVSPASLAAADASLGRVSIATFGAKGSLNVGVAFGIAMNAWARSLVSGSGYFPA